MPRSAPAPARPAVVAPSLLSPTPPPVVPKAALEAGPGPADARSRQLFGAFHDAIVSESAMLTGLFNVETGQMLFGENSHRDLAGKYGLATVDRSNPKKPCLLPGWYGFRCFATKYDNKMWISPESGSFGKMPPEHLPAFRKAMGELLADRQFSALSFEYESVVVARRQAEMKSK